MSTPIILPIVLGAVALLIILLYNMLVGARMRARTAWSQIDTQLKRRSDLIPNLVAAVRGYFGHEASALEAVTKARETAMNAGSDPAQRIGAERALTGALGQLMARVEAMPDLKADATVLALQEELATTENRIAFARSHYNDSVGRYNTQIASFPTLLVAAPLGFTAEPFFALDGPATVPVIDLSRAA